MSLAGPAPVKDMLDGTHPAGCTYGGFSCGYWLIADGCELEHWEKHYTHDDDCPCGTTFPGCGDGIAIFDATSEDHNTDSGPVGHSRPDATPGQNTESSP